MAVVVPCSWKEVAVQPGCTKVVAVGICFWHCMLSIETCQVLIDQRHSERMRSSANLDILRLDILKLDILGPTPE